jgi:hypothetical protein
MRLLLECGSEVNARDPKNGTSETCSHQLTPTGNTILHVAAVKGNVSAIFIALEFGAPLLAINAQQRTPREAASAARSWLRAAVTGCDPAGCLARFGVSLL